ncbi:MAG TPA: DinB family protein [Ktedonobacteraceae bacterium]|nr:DinB family protein [Ktedonobacteraceae bacterium]
MKIIQKPLAGEYAPYAIMYIDLVPDDGLLLQHLQDNLEALERLVAGLSDAQLSTPCAAGEWTIKEILVHIIDTERMFAYRALRFARNDATALASFEQDDYVANSGANARGIDDILAELRAVRAASIALFNSLSEEAWTRSGLASGHRLSVRAAAYQVAGHEQHHVKSIKENYLSQQES